MCRGAGRAKSCQFGRKCFGLAVVASVPLARCVKTRSPGTLPGHTFSFRFPLTPRLPRGPALGTGDALFARLSYVGRLTPVLLFQRLHLIFQTELQLFQTHFFHLLVFREETLG